MKLTIEWDSKKKQYNLSENDAKILADYNITKEEFEVTTKEIEKRIELRPFEYH